MISGVYMQCVLWRRGCLCCCNIEMTFFGLFLRISVSVYDSFKHCAMYENRLGKKMAMRMSVVCVYVWQCVCVCACEGNHVIKIEIAWWKRCTRFTRWFWRYLLINTLCHLISGKQTWSPREAIASFLPCNFNFSTIKKPHADQTQFDVLNTYVYALISNAFLCFGLVAHWISPRLIRFA